MDNDHSRILLSIILFAVGGACLYLVFPTVWNSGEWDGPIDFILFFALPIVVTCAIGIWQMYDEWDMWWIAELLLLLVGGGMMYVFYEYYPKYEPVLLPCIVYIAMAVVCVIVRILVYAQEFADDAEYRADKLKREEEAMASRIKDVTGIGVRLYPFGTSYKIEGLEGDLDALILLQQSFNVRFEVHYTYTKTHHYTKKNQKVGQLESGHWLTGDYQRVDIRMDVQDSYDTQEKDTRYFSDFPTAVSFAGEVGGSIHVKFDCERHEVFYII